MHTVIDNTGKIDIETLMRLARDKSVGSRTKLADIIGDLFFGASDTLNDAEQSIMTDILRQLVQDVEVSVRKHLAIQLSNQDQAPHDLVIALANDDSEVAYPLLLRSRVLRDQDLVAIIHHRTVEHQLAVSMHDSISPTVSDSLAKTGEETVIKRLLENPNAEIARDTMAHLVEQSRRLDSLQKPLVHRSDLPGDLAEKMYWWVSAALRSHIVEHFDVDANEIDAAMESAVNTAFGAQGEGDAALSATDRVAKHLAEKQDPDGDLIIRLLRESEITLFERVIEHQTGLRRKLLQRLLYEPGGEGLAIVCRALDLAPEFFREVLTLTRKARVGLDENNINECTFATTFYDQLEVESAKLMLSRWRRNPNYLDLLRQLETLPHVTARPVPRQRSVA
ncbi:MAG: DUF2336 domain-containing protein [Alphaproteobacteria bacterium]|nr:DUF2336 domain-containing protein [Alphaproteobacteria bacterium]